MKNSVSAVLLVGILLLNAAVLFAEGPTKEAAIDQDIQMLRKDLRSEKKQIVAANMQLTEAEALKFWPVYDQYTAETIKVNDTRLALIKEYAQSYESLTDSQAQNFIKRWLEADDTAVKLRLKYVPNFSAVLPAKKTARFLQIDRRLGLLTDIQVASGLPLVQP